MLAPALTSPSNGATDQALSLTLDWQDATFAVSYEYQLDDDIAFGSPFVSGSPSLSQAAISGLSYATTYYWRVRSYDGVNYSAWSTIWSFTTGTLTAPSLISPANGASNQVVNNLILDWGDVTGASLYEYYYDTDISFSNPVHAVVTVSQVSISGLSNNTSYFWKVRSSDGTTYSPFTSVWSFTTETGVGFEENSELSVLLYPNPASESSTLEFGDAADRTVCIVNSTGMVVNEIRTTESKLDLDLSGLNPGVYMIIVRDSKETKTLRLIRK
ncbi:hypothetical protein SDC9_103781 [bioreactor metagenome]|uniref:Secretion system C-terminal sorting domain-containing protein n=1 Tax=bioreactor metagenome TaxID=1076179 RepID=A0A645B5F8_9ZZZZ